MPRQNENQHVEQTPHFDGERESIINDPTASAGATIGIQLGKGDLGLQNNPLHITPKRDPEMEKLKNSMGSHKVE